MRAERPDDSGQYDDDTLISIIVERFERDADPITKRDGLWLAQELTEHRLFLAEALRRLKGVREIVNA